MKNSLLLLFLLTFLTTCRFKAQLLDSLSLDTLTACTSLQEGLKNPDKVIKLELKKQKLKTFPKEIFSFKNLQYLDLSKNQIKEIPDSIAMLSQLQYMNLNRNKLERVNPKISTLENLYYLGMNNNELYSLPPQIGNLINLKVLDLWSNNLEDFPETLQNLKNLKIMYLQNILMSEELQKKIQNLLPNTKVYFSPSCNCKL